MSNDSPLIKLEGMLSWIRMRPQNYCHTLGELDSILHFLHEVWAKFADREAEYNRILEAPRASRLAELADSDRVLFIGAKHPLEQEIVAYWAEVDAALGIEYREDVVWDDCPRGGIIDDAGNGPL